MVDLTFLEKFTKGDSIKMKRYISLYLEMAPRTFEEMEKNIKENNWNQLRINAHSLKPQADFMGIEKLRHLLIQIEENIENDCLANIEKLYNETFHIHRESKKVLETKLMSI